MQEVAVQDVGMEPIVGPAMKLVLAVQPVQLVRVAQPANVIFRPVQQAHADNKHNQMAHHAPGVCVMEAHAVLDVGTVLRVNPVLTQLIVASLEIPAAAVLQVIHV